MKIFKVPQREVKVRLLQESGEESEGVLYAPKSGPSGGPGRLSDRLNDARERFLPLVGSEGAWLISKSWIVSLRLPRGEEELEFHESDQASERSVEMTLKEGIRLNGLLRYTMPVERCRILDYLNGAPQFIPLLQGDRVLLVNSSFIVRIRDVAGAD